MGKQVNFLLGISLALVMILFSTISAYALHEITFTLTDTINDDLKNPTDIVVDSTGRIIVADLKNNNVKIYDATVSLVHTITDADGPGPRDNFSSPWYVAVDSRDRIIVTDGDNHRTQVFNSDGSFAFSISPTLSARGVAVDSRDRIIIAEVFKHNIKIYSPTGDLLQTISDGGNTIRDVWGVAVDSNDRIIVTEYNRNVFHIFNSDGSLVETVTTPGSNQRGIATDYLDRILITDQTNEQIHIYNSTAHFVTTVSHENTDFEGITTACGNKVIVADIWNHNILFFDLYIHEEEETIDSCSIGSGGGNSCGYDCIPPSLESIELNNVPNWLTVKNQIFNIGDKQEMKFRYSDNRGIERIDLVDIGFGLKTKYNSISESEVILEIFTENGFYKSENLIDPNNLFVENATKVKVEHVNCIADDCSELEYTVEFMWAEKPFYGFSLMTATDNRGNASYERHPEEIKVIGETLNVQPTLEIYNRSTSIMKDGMFINITRTDKVLDLWNDENDRQWQGFGNDRFEIIPLTLADLSNNP